jgi:hypothetical protein
VADSLLDLAILEGDPRISPPSRLGGLIPGTDIRLTADAGPPAPPADALSFATDIKTPDSGTDTVKYCFLNVRTFIGIHRELK